MIAEDDSNRLFKSRTQRRLQRHGHHGGTRQTSTQSESSLYISTHLLNLQSQLPVYLIGAQALAVQLEAVGVRCIGVGADHADDYMKDVSLDLICRSTICPLQTGFVTHVPQPEKVFAVVTSYDPHFNYIKLFKALNYLKDPSIGFYVSRHGDRGAQMWSSDCSRATPTSPIRGLCLASGSKQHVNFTPPIFQMS